MTPRSPSRAESVSMMLILVGRNLSASRVATAAALLLLFLFFSLGTYLFSTFGETNRDAMSSVSPEFLIAFFGGALAGFQPVDLWLITLYAHPLLIVVLIATVVGPVVRDICGEIDRGTIDLLLGCPIPRWVVPVSVWLAAQVTLALIAFVLWIAAITGGHVLGADSADGQAVLNALPRYKQVLLQYWLLGQAIVGVSLWFSVRASLSSRALGKTIGFVIFSFFLNLLAGIWSVIAPLRWASLFHYYQPQPVLSGESQLLERGVLGGVALGLLIASTLYFSRRDIEGA